MSALRKWWLTLLITLLSERSDVRTYFNAFNLGAYKVTSKPISMKEQGPIVKNSSELSIDLTDVCGASAGEKTKWVLPG